jgi:NADH-quinone oxidoreductase subunit G
LSIGYGDGVSRFSEGKRVVKDKDIGPLIQTEMTRCIHCTRCVRFGQEIAGVKELGATGRGEHMEIGTYVEHSLVSELSGNIIDLCPVGALTSKPFRYKARAWEMKAHPSVAPHDAIGSNIELHVRKEQVMRVVPRDNEAINESWISDRDRFSYLGLNSEQRLTEPMIKVGGKWQTTDWQTALETAVDGLKTVLERHGHDEAAGLISPTTTLEEAYLFQKWLRGLGVNSIDHRLRQQDFTDTPLHYTPSQWDLSDINHSDAIVLMGCHVRAEMPILAHRIRQSAMQGATVSSLNFLGSDLLMPMAHEWVMNATEMLETLAGAAKVLMSISNYTPEPEWLTLLPDRAATAAEQNLAMQLSNAVSGTLIVGELINHHPQASLYRSLAALMAKLSGSQLLVLPTANACAHQIANTLPEANAFNASTAWQHCLRAYVLMGIDPLRDTANPQQAAKALQKASFVVGINSFISEAMSDYADVLLPMACFTETSGTFVGLDGQRQSFAGAIPARGDSRPGWKILRVLGNVSHLKGFDFVSSQDVVSEIESQLALKTKTPDKAPFIPEELRVASKLMLISEVPIYGGDNLVRHSPALQQTPETQLTQVARLHPTDAAQYGISSEARIRVKQGEYHCVLSVQVDSQIASGCLYLAATTPSATQLGAMFGEVQIEVVD